MSLEQLSEQSKIYIQTLPRNKENPYGMTGKRVLDMNGNYSGKIIGVIAIKEQFPRAKYPAKIMYETDMGELTLDWLVMVSLIEGGYAINAFGFTFRIVD